MGKLTFGLGVALGVVATAAIGGAGAWCHFAAEGSSRSGACADAHDDDDSARQPDWPSLRNSLGRATAEFARRIYNGTSAPDSARSISGVVIGPDGRPAAEAQVFVVRDGVYSPPVATDAEGRFVVDRAAPEDSRLFAYKEGAAAWLDGNPAPGSRVTLRMSAPGWIEGELKSGGAPIDQQAFLWMGYSGVATMLPGGSAMFSGGHFRLRVPAGDHWIHVASRQAPALGGHARVHVESGQTTAVAIPMESARASVQGHVTSDATGRPLTNYRVTLTMPDNTHEASYPPHRSTFKFSGRTEGDRELLFTANGYRSKRVAVHIEQDKALDLGNVVLER